MSNDPVETLSRMWDEVEKASARWSRPLTENEDRKLLQSVESIVYALEGLGGLRDENGGNVVPPEFRDWSPDLIVREIASRCIDAAMAYCAAVGHDKRRPSILRRRAPRGQRHPWSEIAEQIEAHKNAGRPFTVGRALRHYRNVMKGTLDEESFRKGYYRTRNRVRKTWDI
jgi:hypothetical protein